MQQSHDSVFVRKAGLPTAPLGEELVVLDASTGACYGLNGTASEVWQLIETPRSLDAVCGELMEKFEIDEDRCRAETSALLKEWSDAGLVQMRPSGAV
jgi:hypothetical protein